MTRFFTGFAVSDGSIFIGGNDDGVYVSTNKGSNWKSVNEGLSDTRITSLADFGPWLFAGSQSSGMWKRYTSEMLVHVQHAKLYPPRGYRLDQNYPNPFNPTTVIHFALTATTTVRIKVFDLFGRDIETLVDERLEAGDHSVSFDGRRCSSGTYFYSLSANGYSVVRKMMLVK